ncbi:carbon-nitrogen hydrolase family protein [Cocleimonas sp. KMM 6892]|uniref:carbon-nitrogen hydrolase family protein n=1 Tax=unclassified Cocleimonas TaxID=2639732 RepID=UPI002DBC5549|nr:MULTISPECIES: carbon-nitrogen hydrolase family protein [unclassified Cocleimonas]MEB8433714.1 carbon-nitrogen hydrolase family protein [Cocleimonas sp. KMM 6892]MEC4716525.1 carbon-nitrogen hydrolase family protein [Cocleimonas sp. KMM 6895]MEC4746320.1 carbon-nitrogen hydrolase family protein [Cocleimonas sp. KMM 6896]
MSLNVAIFQSDADESDVRHRVNKLEKALVNVPESTDLLVCPELFTSGYNMGEQLKHRAESQLGETAKHVAELAKHFNTAIVYGYPEQEEERIYNSALCIDKHGETLINHRKLLLPPGFEADHFDSGKNMSYFNIGAFKCCVLICYDAEFPESIRAAALAGVHAVIIPTALSENWGVVSEKVMPTRAFENGIWVIYANHSGTENNLRYYGGSCIVQPDGIDAARAGAGEETIFAKISINAVEAAQTRLPYLSQIQTLKALISD